MTKISFPAVISFHDQEVHIDFPDLPAAFASGSSVDEAVKNAKLALALVIIDMTTHYEDVPTASSAAKIRERHPRSNIRMITVDLDKY